MTQGPPPSGKARFMRREQGANTMLPYARHLDPATLLLKDGSLAQCIHVSGLAFETADTEELNYRKALRETLLRGLASPRLSMAHHVLRRKVAPSLSGDFDNPFARSLDTLWRRRLASRALLVNDLIFTLVLRPSIQLGARWLRRTGDDADAARRSRDKRDLEAARDALLSSFQPYGARTLTTYEAQDGLYSEPLEFLGCLFNGDMTPVMLTHPEASRDIPRRRVSFGQDALELGPIGDGPRSFGAMISIKEYPSHTSPGQLDALYRLPHELVVSQSFAFADRQTALSRMNLTLRRMRAADDDALSLRRDLVTAKDDVAAGRSAFGEHHLSVLVRADDQQALNDAVADVQATLTESGALSVRETYAMEPTFWAQFPGNAAYVGRRALISSGNFASFASCHNHPLGRADDNHWGPAVTILETTAASPYHFNFHQGDIGNFLIIGPSGGGKTVLLNFLLAQAQKFDPFIAFFDKDRGGEIFIRAMGGRYDVLRPGVRTGFNPLQLPDTHTNRRFLQAWTANLLSAHGETLNAEDHAVIANAVAASYDQSPALRRLRYFRELFAGARRPTSGDLAARLAPWVGDGDRAWLFDNETDQLSLDARAVGFDMTQLLDDPVTRTATMLYLFHRVEERMDGTPSIIVIDEGWKALDDDVFVTRIRDWEKTIRKRNGIVGFATQSAADALESRIASAIIEQSPTQIFLPNPKAQERDYCKGFGLTRHEFNLIRTLPDTSRCFLIKHGGDSVVARLNLKGDEDLLTVLSGRERSVRRLDALRAEVGDDPAVWLPRLLKAL